MKRRVINLTLEELVTKVKSLEEQVINLAARQSNRSADADSGISEAKAKTEEVKRESEGNLSEGWNEKHLFVKDDYCLWNNAMWIAKYDNVGQEPNETSPYWEKKNVVGELNRLNKMIKEMER